MTNKFVTRVLQAQTDDGDAALSALGAGGGGGQLSSHDLSDCISGRKWPRLMRLAIALGFASSFWIVLLAKLYV